MPDLIIKPTNTSGNKVIIQDQAGGAVLTTADSGATIANATLDNTTQDNITRLGTVTSGNLSNTAIVYPVGHIIKTTTNTSSTSLTIISTTAIVAESDADDITVSCTAGNKLHVWIIGGMLLNLTSSGYFTIGVRIKESGQSDIDKNLGVLYARNNLYYNDAIPSMAYSHTAVTSSVTFKRFIRTDSNFSAYWESATELDQITYIIMEEQR